MILSYLLPLLLFVPGAVLFYLISSIFKLALSKLETIVLGGTFWIFLLVVCSYIGGILTSAMDEFFIVFTGFSVFLLIFGACFVFEQKNHVRLLKVLKVENSNNLLLLLLTILLIVLVFTVTTSHSMFNEFDAIFYYLPSAKSMVHTGSLQFDYYRQSGLTTTTSPATPIIYAWLNYLIADPTSLELTMRLIPFIYILLTSVLVYLITKEVSKDSTIATIGSIIFLSLPVVLSIATNFSLYLDIPFTFLFFLSIYLLQKILSAKNARSFWWGMLGIAAALMLLEKDLGFFVLPSLAALILAYIGTHVGKKWRIILFVAISIVFFGSYNFFFILDLYHSSYDIIYTICRQVPVFLFSAIFIGMLFKMSGIDARTLPTKKQAMLLVIPFIPVMIFLLRNLYSFGAITDSLPLFNSSWKTATMLISQSSVSVSSSASDAISFFRWDVLLTSLSLGAVFLVPLILGLFKTINSFFSEGTDRRDYFLLLSAFMILVVMWSWNFNCSYLGPEMRRLYYFAPLFSIFAALGISVVVKNTNIKKSLVPRFVMLIFLVFVYFLLFKSGLISSSTAQLSDRFLSMGIATVEELVVFAFFFFVSFFPVNLIDERVVLSKSKKLLLKCVHAAIPVLLIVIMILYISIFSFSMLPNSGEAIRYIPPQWENNLGEVISYINQNITDNSTIITCYAPEIAYFTDHPVIEVTQGYGVTTLLSLFANSDNMDQIVDICVKQNIRYLLIPKPGNSKYNYFINLSENFPLLNMKFISKNPSIALIQEFSEFKLYEIITPSEISTVYGYLTFFGNGWVPLNNYSKVTSSTQGVSITSEAYPIKVIADDNQDTFWEPGKANISDEITLSNDQQVKVVGNDSLKISLSGTGNMVIGHVYSTPQDFSSMGIFNAFIYGANTSKSIVITFHTVAWQDYYSTSVTDDFIGWKKISIPLDEFYPTGNPSWSNITYIEILMGDRIATYHLDQISLGPPVGLQGQLPPITTNASQIPLLVSVGESSLQFAGKIVLTSSNGELEQDLVEGVNYVAVPTDLLKEGAILKISYPPTNNSGEELDIHYLVEGVTLGLAATASPQSTIPWIEVLTSPYTIAFDAAFFLCIAVYFVKKRNVKTETADAKDNATNYPLVPKSEKTYPLMVRNEENNGET